MSLNSLQDMAVTSEVNLTGPMALPDEKAIWLADAADAIERLARSGRNFTADDVRSMIGEPLHGNWVGIAFATAKNAKTITAVAFGTARAKSRNGGSLKVWRGTDA